MLYSLFYDRAAEPDDETDALTETDVETDTQREKYTKTHETH